MICRSFAFFSSDLFTVVPTDPAVQECLLVNISSSLPQDQAEQCDGLLTVEECYEAVIGMAKCKAPGSDGLSMEFYVKFWGVLGLHLVEILNSWFQSGSLCLSLRSGVISRL